jgi:hypothetical protein
MGYVDTEQSNKNSPKKTVKKRFAPQRDEGEGQGPSTPPPVPRNFKRTEEDDDDEVWYAKLWMFGLADSSKALGLVPARGRYGRLISLFLGGRDASRKKST